MEKAFKVDQLSIHIYKDKYQLGKAAADKAEKYISNAIDKKGEAVIILATGASQFEFLDSLTKKKIDWKKVVAFHLDEYVGLPASHPASFRRYLRERIIDKVGMGTYYLIEGDCEDVETECKRLDDLLVKYTVDVAFVGIGENGHLAFNEPPANFNDKVKFKVVELNEVSRKQQMGEGWFKSLIEVPRYAITMTVSAIMDSRTIICTVPDARKAEAVKNTLSFDISSEFPASILRKHVGAMLFLERDSASLLDEAIMRI
jgi:glucosamine-6-phosphate deaminase